MDHDAIIIGSGFGGSVTACRLAEAGFRVLVLERGRRWDRTNYPRKPGDAWWWDPERPEAHNGWIDLRIFRQVSDQTQQLSQSREVRISSAGRDRLNGDC